MTAILGRRFAVVSAAFVAVAACGGRLLVPDCGPNGDYCEVTDTCCPHGALCGNGDNGCPLHFCCTHTAPAAPTGTGSFPAVPPAPPPPSRTPGPPGQGVNKPGGVTPQ